jgi:hypothetical protein
MSVVTHGLSPFSGRSVMSWHATQANEGRINEAQACVPNKLSTLEE